MNTTENNKLNVPSFQSSDGTVTQTHGGKPFGDLAENTVTPKNPKPLSRKTLSRKDLVELVVEGMRESLVVVDKNGVGIARTPSEAQHIAEQIVNDYLANK